MMRKLASVKKITSLNLIPGADRIEIAEVDNGWKVVVGKGEYEVGEKVIYIEPDSWVPINLAPFLRKGEPKFFKGVEGEKLSAVKLKNQVSMGLILKLKDNSELGTDLTQVLGILKWENENWEPDIKGTIPTFIRDTSLDRVQNLHKQVFDSLDDFEVTVKIDGCSITVFNYESHIGLCTKEVEIEESSNNNLWKIARELKLIEAAYKLPGFAIQGELVKSKPQDIHIFSIWDINKQKYLSPMERRKIVKELNLAHVPVVEENLVIKDNFNSIQDILDFADGYLPNGKKREGLVFKSNTRDFCFKVISNRYLLNN